ncbi:MAG: helix-turn-helix transcriptional regulator [Bryobacterales bacterium]|nr:helix-turn-helix transcriptional regulator [Bryobacterales bacterium]
MKRKVTCRPENTRDDGRNEWPSPAASSQVSGAALKLSQGAVYPALIRLEQEGWIRADPRPVPMRTAWRRECAR